jgi:hypothetical protein
MQTCHSGRLVGDLRLARFNITTQIGADKPEAIRHQHGQGLSQKFSARIAEDFLGRAIDEEHRAVFIYGYDGI